jgi:hypothetical protein
MNSKLQNLQFLQYQHPWVLEINAKAGSFHWVTLI